MTNITEDMRIGWNACRRQVYLLAEYEQAKTGETDFERGCRYMAKSFAKALNAFEADDCDFLQEATAQLVSPAWDANPDGPGAA